MNKNFSRIIDESISPYLTQNIITEKKSKKDSKKEDDKDENKVTKLDDEDEWRYSRYDEENEYEEFVIHKKWKDIKNED